ncbi:MAG: DUF1697 domain-containing protein [Erysipelotrichaceae bacterium]|nr:DUF1697 domain-containing protein [Erysipelotrichaceae bacterium]
MERYIALLRGINISGKNKIPMPELKEGFIHMGFNEVKTHLNSGNIIFNSDEADIALLSEEIRNMISERFDLDIPVLVIPQQELKRQLESAPEWWGSEDKAIYDNLIFIFPEYTAQMICEKIGEPSEGLEQIFIHEKVIFWSFDLARHAKANWWKKTAMAGIGEMMTIRTANTSRKIAEM